jgi:hypothetical protein
MKRLQDKVMGVSTITPGNDRTTRPSKVPQAFQEKVQRYNVSYSKHCILPDPRSVNTL